MPTVGIYHADSVADMIKLVFKDFRPSKPSRPSPRRIGIKPNLCNYNSPETGSTTDVKVVREICKALLSIRDDMEIFVLESDGSNVNCDLAFKLLGYHQLANEFGAKLVNLSKTEKSMVFPERTSYFKKFEYPSIFDNIDFFISAPKLKTMAGYGITCALKNQFGCNPDKRKLRYHPYLDAVISDLNKIFRPDLVIVDGLVAMEGRGPAGGSPKKMGILVAGDDPVAVDYVCCKLMGINPAKISQITVSKEAGTGTWENIQMIRGDIERYKSSFRNPCSTRGKLLDFAARMSKKAGVQGVL